MRGVDHGLVEDLLRDESLSYREIARRANCSDWSVRAIARQLDDAKRGCGPPAEALTARDWAICAGIVVAIFGGIWFLWRRLPPMDGTM